MYCIINCLKNNHYSKVKLKRFCFPDSSPWAPNILGQSCIEYNSFYSHTNVAQKPCMSISSHEDAYSCFAAETITKSSTLYLLNYFKLFSTRYFRSMIRIVTSLISDDWFNATFHIDSILSHANQLLHFSKSLTSQIHLNLNSIL